MKLLGRTTEQVSVRGQGASGHKHTEWVDNLHIRAGGTYLGTDEVNGTVWGCCVQLYILCAVYSYLSKVAVGAGIGGLGPHQATQRGKGSSSLQGMHPQGHTALGVSLSYLH